MEYYLAIKNTDNKLHRGQFFFFGGRDQIHFNLITILKTLYLNTITL